MTRAAQGTNTTTRRFSLSLACRSALFYIVVFASTFAFLADAAAEARVQTTYEKGLEKFSHRQFAESIPIFKQAIKEDPKDADAWTFLGRAYMMQDQFPQAIEACTTAIELNPQNAQAYTFREFCHFQLKHIREGLEDSEKAIKYYKTNTFEPSLVWALDNRVRACRMIRRPDLIEQDLNVLQTYEILNKAIKHREWARLNDALATVDQAIKNMPKNSDMWFFRGVVNSNKRDFWNAAADFSNAIRCSPDAWFLYYFRADVYQQLNQNREAVRDLTTVINAHPRLAAYRFTCETGRLRDQGIRVDESPITLEDIYFLRAESQAELGNIREAADDLTEALKLDPTDTKALSLRAEYVSERGKNDVAIKDFTEAIRQNPSDWSKYQQRGNAYLKLGKVKEAMEDFSEIIKRNPKDPGSYLIRALARAKEGDNAGALADYSEVIKLTPNDDDAYLARGVCLKSLKRYKEALDDFNQAEKLNSENESIVMEEKAKLYVETGQEALARSQTQPLDTALAAKRPNYLLYGTIGGLAVISIAAIFLWKRKRKRKQNVE